MICECEHPASAHDLGGQCDLCICQENAPIDTDDIDWLDQEADVNDFRDTDEHTFRAGWNDNPWADGH